MELKFLTLKTQLRTDPNRSEPNLSIHSPFFFFFFSFLQDINVSRTCRRYFRHIFVSVQLWFVLKPLLKKKTTSTFTFLHFNQSFILSSHSPRGPLSPDLSRYSFLLLLSSSLLGTLFPSPFCLLKFRSLVVLCLWNFYSVQNSRKFDGSSWWGLNNIFTQKSK